MAWFDFLDPALKPLLNLGPFWVVLIMSLVLSLLITLVYKLVTNQELMKKLKEEQKEYQQKIKGLRDNPQEMMKIQKEAMKKNMEYMKHSFKATLITFIPLILIFGWMNAHLSFEEIRPGESYGITAFFGKGASGEAELIADEKTEVLSEKKQQVGEEVNWKVKSEMEGNHVLEIRYNNQSFTKKVLISKELAYEEPIEIIKDSELKQIKINQEKLRPLGREFSLFGWQPGWLGIYIIFSIVFSMGLRKLLKVY